MYLHQTIAYVYKWTNSITGKWYIGCRTKAGCNPNDGYLCSSRIVKPLILKEGCEVWFREILCVGKPEYIMEMEARFLVSLDAKNDPASYNQHNGDGKFSTVGIEPWNKGLKLPRGTPAWNRGKNKNNDPSVAKISASRQGQPAHNKGKPMSEELKLQKSITMKGRPSPKKGIPGPKASVEAREKMSLAKKGRPSHRKGKKVGPYKKKKPAEAG